MEEKNKFEIENKARFWLGIALIVPEFLILIIFGLSLIEQSLLLSICSIVAIVLYNAIAGILIWNGSRVKKKTVQKK